MNIVEILSNKTIDSNATPLTDSAEAEGQSGYDFARTLEKRLNAYEKKAEFWRKQYGGLSREQLLGETIARAVCREADMRKMEQLEDRIKDLESKRP
jgi:hypothetical protein